MTLHRPILLSLSILAATSVAAFAECASGKLTMASTPAAEPVVVATVAPTLPPVQPTTVSE